ncbi:oxidoreductase [Methylopila jiangsuensis]|uniref:Oxidoreductase n=1 Tax=Methylopila jiangsuensis TaxID=586230 RepID=A0A9W6JJB9_9HYPH|nr:LLM class flavin-dependent oxidoreductase [Methylopila jiangsuensis]MDR6285161.1 alkanesulfonate monooxygenase [Methylopila jiangsuensis]GLK77451.1 oxidoreductase [Methylopila jiangsuensis]
MATLVGGQAVEFYVINTRNPEPDSYWPDVKNITALSDRFDLDGILCFSSNDTLVDPWLTAQHVLASSRRLTPIIAVNPVYQHPITSAKMVSSLAYMYGRQVALNLITGAAARDREVLHDDVAHDDRYVRLTEYAELMRSLLWNASLTSFSGDFYNVSAAKILPHPPAHLLPTFMVAGHSAAAERTAAAVDAVRMRMLAPDLADATPAGPHRKGVHLGVVTRKTAAEAWTAARTHFPPEPDGEGVLEMTMETSDSAWKRKLYDQLRQRQPAHDGFWLEPFGQFQADCPYFVGSHDEVAEMLSSHVTQGVRWFILDMPSHEEEFENLDIVLNVLGARS